MAFIYLLPEHEIIKLLDDRKNYEERFFRKIRAIAESVNLGVNLRPYGGVYVFANNRKKAILLTMTEKNLYIESEVKMNELLYWYR